MKLRLIRNATMILDYGGRRILTDPMLSDKFAYDPLNGVSRNPTVDLPDSAEDIISGIDLCIISHLHRDHFDPQAQELLPKNLPIYCQPGDEYSIKSGGFTNVTRVDESVELNGIELNRVPGQHGSGIWAEHMGCVSGFVLVCEEEPVIYWTGDTILYEEVKKVINRFSPDLVITHSGGASIGSSGPIIMDAVQTVELCKSTPDVKVVAIHLESLDHLKVTRTNLRNLAVNSGVSEHNLLIPEDGEVLKFNKIF